MNKIIKSISLSLAAIAATTALFGCSGASKYAEEIALVSGSVDKIVSSEAGEVLVHDTIDIDTNVKGYFENGYIETYIRFNNNNDVLDFSYIRSVVPDNGGMVSSHEIIKKGETVFELFDGVGDEVEMTEFPDFHETFRINYLDKDIKEVTSEIIGNGVDLYTFKMKDKFINSFDSDTNGVKVDCVDVTYGYYIDSSDNLEKMTTKYTYRVTVDGKTQTAVRLVNSQAA